MNGVQVEPKASKGKPSIERGRRGSRNLGRTVAPPIHLMAEMELRGARLGSADPATASIQFQSQELKRIQGKEKERLEERGSGGSRAASGQWGGVGSGR